MRKSLIKKSFLIFLTILFLLQLPGLAQKIISWKDAHKYYGEYVTVEGTIVDTYNSGKACFLNFHPDYNKYFT